MIELRTEPGYAGVFTRHQAPGAIPNGSRVVKIRRDAGDAHAVGTTGVVLGSFGPVGEEVARSARAQGIAVDPGEFGYFVEWDPTPRAAVLVRGRKLARVGVG